MAAILQVDTIIVGVTAGCQDVNMQAPISRGKENFMYSGTDVITSLHKSPLTAYSIHWISLRALLRCMHQIILPVVYHVS